MYCDLNWSGKLFTGVATPSVHPFMLLVKETINGIAKLFPLLEKWEEGKRQPIRAYSVPERKCLPSIARASCSMFLHRWHTSRTKAVDMLPTNVNAC